MEAKYEVLAHWLNVRERPDASSKIVGSAMPKGTQIVITKIEKDSLGNSWGQHSTGWSSITYGKNTWLKHVENLSPPAPTSNVPAKTIEESQLKEDDADIVQARQITDLYSITADATFKIRSARSILGLPHQFLHTVDQRVPNSDFGRMFTENILMDMPICTIIPGEPVFLKEVSASRRSDMAQIMAEAATAPADRISELIEEVLGEKNARYYSFATQFTDYMKYVNSLNRTLSQYLGIHKEKLRPSSKPYESFDWKNANIESDLGEGVLKFIADHQTVNVYYDRASTQMNETSSNATDKSMLDGYLNQASNLAREADFLFGVGAGRSLEAMDPSNVEQKLNTLSKELANKNTLFEGIMTNLKAGMATTLSGANMLLPEIWRDSALSKSYTLEVTLATPYGSAEAFYLNVGVPLNFLLALAFPRQLGANAYHAPFIIQVFAKGLFNCNLAIVENISISRFGSGDSIARERYPLEVKVSIQFKDLYTAMGISTTENYGLFVNNRSMMDFIATLAGVSLAEPDAKRKLNILIDSYLNRIKDIPGNIESSLYDNFRDALERLKLW